mgnify:FL=1|tara:strand:+ start:681 stop:1607 length:927 start_codon:yes stop_codon:yes gene_type:complete
MASALKQTYYYKIDGKKVSKADYNNYSNKPGDMEGGGKTTDDPDASGNKAKIAKDRSNNKASKKPTALTEAQTKLVKKPPFKAKQSQRLGGAGRSPLHFDWKTALDSAQLGLAGAGMVPAWGAVPDLLNTGLSLGRAGYAKYKGDKEGTKEHLKNAALNGAMAIPIAGQSVAGTSLAIKAGNAMNKVQKGKKIVDGIKKTQTGVNTLIKGNKYAKSTNAVNKLTSKLVVGKGTKNAYNLVSGKVASKGTKIGGAINDAVSKDTKKSRKKSVPVVNKPKESVGGLKLPGYDFAKGGTTKKRSNYVTRKA